MEIVRFVGVYNRYLFNDSSSLDKCYTSIEWECGDITESGINRVEQVSLCSIYTLDSSWTSCTNGSKLFPCTNGLESKMKLMDFGYVSLLEFVDAEWRMIFYIVAIVMSMIYFMFWNSVEENS
jgi:hypothetical protein